MPLDVACERLRVQFLRSVVLGVRHALEVVERELCVDGHELLRVDDGVDALSAGERVLEVVGVGRQAVAQEILEQQLAEAAAGLRRPQRLLEPAEILGAVDHLGRRLRDLAEPFVDLRRRLAGGFEAPVDLRVELAEAAIHRLDDGPQLAIDGVVPRLELGRSLGAKRAELAAEEPRQQHDSGREQRRRRDR